MPQEQDRAELNQKNQHRVTPYDNPLSSKTALDVLRTLRHLANASGDAQMASHSGDQPEADHESLVAVRDREQNPIKVEDKHGKVLWTCRWDSHGKLTEVHMRDGTYFAHGDDGRWHKYKKTGEVLPGRVDNVEVNYSGDITVTMGKRQYTRLNDGHTGVETRHDPSGDTSIVRQDGRVVAVLDSKSSHLTAIRRFGYDNSGHLKSATIEPGGPSFEQGQDGRWVVIGTDGKTIGHAKSVTVDAEGNLKATYTDRTGTHTIQVRVDGSKTEGSILPKASAKKARAGEAEPVPTAST